MGEVFLGRYEAEAEVGQGGMAVVYRGIDRVLHRPVAIKVLHPHLCQRPDARARFAREARVIASLRHPNILEVYDFSGEESDRSFLVAEYVDGLSLADFLAAHGPVLPEAAAVITAVLARALAHAHERGVIHRDVKPENLMVRRDGTLKLMDFGIAHVVGTEHLTVTGAILGSPAHMSPEQVDGKALDARTDVFSLGTLLYLAGTGKYPFGGPTAAALLKAIVDARYADPRTVRAGFPDDLAKVLARMLARDPAARYATAVETAEALEAVVAASGLRHGEAEVARLVTDPAGWQAEAARTIVATRLRRAREALRNRRQALAIREADLALALDPGNEEAKRLVARARQAARRRAASRMGTMIAGGAAVLAALVWVAIQAWPEPPPPVVVEAPTPEVARAAPITEAVRSPRRNPVAVELPRSGGNGATKPAVVPKVPPPGREEPAGLPVTIQAYPPAVRILVDGRFVGEGRVDDLALPPGRHSVRLTHPNCAACRDVEETFTLDPANPLRGPLRYSIGYRDASLTVGGPPDARVFLNNEARPRGRTNEVLRIPMTQPKPTQWVVRVEADGEPVRTARVVLEPGKSVAIP